MRGTLTQRTTRPTVSLSCSSVRVCVCVRPPAWVRLPLGVRGSPRVRCSSSFSDGAGQFLLYQSSPGAVRAVADRPRVCADVHGCRTHILKHPNTHTHTHSGAWTLSSDSFLQFLPPPNPNPPVLCKNGNPLFHLLILSSSLFFHLFHLSFFLPPQCPPGAAAPHSRSAPATTAGADPAHGCGGRAETSTERKHAERCCVCPACSPLRGVCAHTRRVRRTATQVE